MMKLSLALIAEMVDGLLVGSDAPVSSVVADSRDVNKDSLFVAISGSNVDGHDYVNKAALVGASGALVSRTGDYLCPTVVVDDTVAALAKLSKAYMRSANAKVVGITGSMGKTSTKEMAAAAISAELSVCRSPGNLNTEIGLPLSILRHRGEDVLVLEMAMRGLGQIAELAAIAPPDVAVITNIGESHLEILGSRENIAKAKGEILLGMKTGGAAILNRDDDYYDFLASLAQGPITAVGYHQQADFRIEAPCLSANGCYSFILHSGRESFELTAPWPGLHNVFNAALAIAVAVALGVDVEGAIAALSLCAPGDKRLNIFTLPCGTQIIDDTYNANPASMDAALHTLDEVSRGRRIAVLGGMLELGPRSEAGHREVGQAACGLCDIVITVGGLAEVIADKTKSSVETHVCKDNKEAIDILKQIIMPVDTVLIKGSRGLKMEQIVAALREGVVGCE